MHPAAANTTLAAASSLFTWIFEDLEPRVDHDLGPGFFERLRRQKDISELRAFLRGQMPDFMVPWAFVTLEAFPLTANGKVDRKALPDPESGALGDGARVAPRGPVEEALAGIFGEILKTTGVSAHDNFFDLGGHSLLATRVIARVRAAFGVELGVQGFFEAPTVAALTARGAASTETVLAPVTVVDPRPESLPLSFAQLRMWFINQFASGGAAYNIPLILRVTADDAARTVDPSVIKAAIVDGPAIQGIAIGTMKGSPSGISPNRPSGVGKIIRMPIRNSTMPPAMLTDSWRRCSRSSRALPEYRNNSRTISAMTSSRASTKRRRAGGRPFKCSFAFASAVVISLSLPALKLASAWSR